jgi:hypothetical protein
VSSEIEFLQAEVQRLAAEAAKYELLWRRAKDGARAATTGLQRAVRREYRARCDLIIAGGEVERLKKENQEQEKKLQRLSLRILSLWGGEGN